MRCIWSPVLIRGNTVWQYYRDEPFLDNNGNITDFPDDNINSTSFKFKTKMAGRIGEEGKKNVKIRLPLNYLGNFWRILEILFINCEINLVLTWPVRCFIIDNPILAQKPTFTITDTKIYVPFVTLSTSKDCNWSRR